jgi:2-keto-4-pentenoate hydratase
MNKSGHDARVLRGMEKQLRLRRQRLSSGERAIGWKVGFGTPAALARLHLDGPLVGFLTDRVLLPAGSSASIRGWTQPAAEPEVAVYLGEDLGGGADRQSARDAIAAVGPAIELADIHFPPDDVEMILAENIYNRHVILGGADASRAGCVLDGLIARISRGARELAPVTDLQIQTGDIVDIVRHVASLLAVFDEKLQAGEIIIAGSIIPPLSVEQNEDLTYTLAPIDTLRISFT